MPRYLDTTGYASLAIAICDRCRFKRPLSLLVADNNSPGLRVCPDCQDDRDPYRLAPRRPDDITLRFPRPDEPLVTPYGVRISWIVFSQV